MKNLFYLSFICLLFISISSNAANFYNDDHSPSFNEEDEVMQIINKMFDGMRKGDSAMVSSVFLPNVKMASIYLKEGQPLLQEGSLERFLKAVGTPHDQVWDEKIWDPIIQIDGNMASVWVNYAFYLGDKFSHCGVNAFQLFKSEDGWKIVNITDTRRRDNCEEPK